MFKMPSERREAGRPHSVMALYDKQYGGYRIFVGDLGPSIRKSDLEKEFDRHGKILDVWMARNPPGFAFLVYKRGEDAEKAVNIMETRIVCGRRIRVEHARPYEKHDKLKKSRHSRSHRNSGRSSKKRRRHSYHRSSSRSRSRSRSKSSSRPRHKSHRHKCSRRDRSSSKDSDHHYKPSHRSSSNEKSRKGLKRSRSPDHERWKRSRSDNSSDDDDDYEEKKNVRSAVKKKVDPSCETEKGEEQVGVSKEVSLCDELEVDESTLNITLLPNDTSDATNGKKDMENGKKEDQSTTTQDPEGAMEVDEPMPQETPPLSQDPDPLPESSQILPPKIETTDVCHQQRNNGETQTEHHTQTVLGPCLQNNEQEQRASIMTSVADEKKDTAAEIAKMCSVETQTDFTHIISHVVYPPGRCDKGTSTETREIATDTNLDFIHSNVSEESNTKKATESNGGSDTHRQPDITSCKVKTSVLMQNNSKPPLSRESIKKPDTENQEKSLIQVQKSDRSILVRNELPDPDQDVSIKGLSPIKNVNGNGTCFDKKIKIEYIQSSRKIMKAHVRDFSIECKRAEKLLQPNVSRTSKGDSWTAGIVLSEQTSQLLSSKDQNIYGIKAM